MDPSREGALWAGICDQIRQQIRSGTLLPGDRIPPSRAMAEELGVSRGTVLAAIELLIAEGLLEGRRGSGTFVAQDATASPVSNRRQKRLPPRVLRVIPDVDPSTDSRINFQPCRPSLEAFPVTPWRRAFAAAAEFTRGPDYGDPRGEPRLREAIATYLRRARGLQVEPDEILISNGAIQAVHWLCRLFARPGDSVAMEDPGYPLARQAFELNGARVVSYPVDEHGLVVDALPADGGGHRLVYVTPSHQFPTGSRLSRPRRVQLIDWAVANGVLVLEDDYDGEFRYDVPPLPPLASLSTCGYVIYLGTFSKTLFPSLRIGFTVAPRELIDELAAYRNALDYQCGALPQIALARFIEDGDFERHILRMRRIYAQKRRALREAMADCNFPGELCGIDSGINGTVLLEPGVPPARVVAAAAKRGIYVTPIERYRQHPVSDDRALILGYGALSEAQIGRGIASLASIVQSA
ncbi:hypothetical protein ABI59_09970 [Acidobacteria bacterium Mor1]|nr:hypothetical protein ABI59_09970 [Acidobacteria bacterium Mor1]